MSDTTTKTICPICESANCFESETDGAFSYLCMRCGSTTNTHFKDGSPLLEEALKNSPQIIQALKCNGNLITTLVLKDFKPDQKRSKMTENMKLKRRWLKNLNAHCGRMDIDFGRTYK